MKLCLGAALQIAFACTVALSLGGCTTAIAPAAPARSATLNETGNFVPRCEPVSERAGREFGCYIVAIQPVGLVGAGPVSWYLDQYPNRDAAEAARGSHSAVVESFGHVWLLSIEAVGWRANAGVRVAEVGPLPVEAGTFYTAQFMEGIFRPGMKTSVHRHSGPEAWYTLTGETCLETPAGIMVGRAGGAQVIVPHGPPMELTATGTTIRRALVLILYDSSQPASTDASDWRPKGLCLSSNSR